MSVPDITETLINPFIRFERISQNYVVKGVAKEDFDKMTQEEKRAAAGTSSRNKPFLLREQVKALKDFYFKIYSGNIKKLREKLIKEKKLSKKESKEALTKENFEWERDTDPLRRDLAIKEFIKRVKNYSLEAPLRPKGDIDQFVAFDENTYVLPETSDGTRELAQLKRKGVKPVGKYFITKEQFKKNVQPEIRVIMGPQLASYFKGDYRVDVENIIPGKKIWRMKTTKDYEYEERDIPDPIRGMNKERRKKDLIEWGIKEKIIPPFTDFTPPPEDQQRDRAGGRTIVMMKYDKMVKGYMTKVQERINKYINEVNKRIKEKEKGKVKKVSAGIGGFQPGMKVDTSKVGVGMGKEVSITEGKKFRQEFKGGAKITWLDHVRKFRDANPEFSYKDALKEAKKTYTPMRKKEREQQKIDTAEKKVAKGPKPRKFSKKQVALRFSAYDEPDYDEDFEKAWNQHIKGKRFKDNEELLKEMKKHYSP